MRRPPHRGDAGLFRETENHGGLEGIDLRSREGRTESQTHRQLASGLSMPVGFKNSTDGSLQPALDVMTAALRPQAFLGIDPEGQTSIVHTSGNPDVHLVLRGGAKDFRRQPEVCGNLASRVRNGEPGVLGLMLESHLVEGRQPIGPDLTYGQSITDGCIGWDQTEALLGRI